MNTYSTKDAPYASQIGDRVSRPPSGVSPVSPQPESLILDRYNAPRPILANAIAALTRAEEWKGVLGFNEFTNAVAAVKAPPWRAAVPVPEWTDHQDRLATEWLQRNGLHVSVPTAADAVEVVARRNPFHPVR